MPGLPGQAESVEAVSDFGTGPAGIQARWKAELKLSEKEYKSYFERVEKIVKRYRDDRDVAQEDNSKLSMLWSSVAIELPAIYQRPPKPVVDRRFKSKNAVTRCAAAILERYLSVELERDHIDNIMPKVVLDRLLGSRGLIWIDYEPVIVPVPTPVPVQQDATGKLTHLGDGTPYEGQPPQPDPTSGALMGTRNYDRVVDCRAPARYLFWRDFLCSASRSWDEVRWVARKHRYTRKEIESKFADGQKAFGWATEDLPLSEDANLGDQEQKEAGDLFKQCVVWEIWNDSDGQRYWISPTMAVPVCQRPQPFRIESRFPCPEPYFGTVTNEKLVPVPDFCQVQDLADEIDELSQRIKMLTKACKVVGARAGNATALDDMLKESTENELVAVDDWAAFADSGGVAGAISWLPIDMVAAVIDKLTAQRQNRIELYSQMSGIGELLRGQGDVDATATHDRITANFGSLRLREKQQDLGRFVEQVLQIKGEIIIALAPPDVLIKVSSIEDTPDGQNAQAAVALLKDERTRNLKIQIEEASMAAIDDEAEKAQRLEFGQTVGPFIQGMVNMPGPLQAVSAEMLSYIVRSFRVGRDIEGSLEQYVAQLQAAAAKAAANPQPPQPPLPLVVQNAKAQAAMVLEDKRHQDRMQEIAAEGEKDAQTARLEGQADYAREQARGQSDVNARLIDGHEDRKTEVLKAQVHPPAPPAYAPTMAMPQRPRRLQ